MMTQHQLPIDNDLPAELTPLREPTLFILLTLSNEHKHGYAILKDVETLSEGRIILSTGTLYGALARLLAQGVIRTFTEAEGQGVRKLYALTQFGRRVLAADLERLGDILKTAHTVLGREGV